MANRLGELRAYRRLSGALGAARGTRLVWQDGRELVDFYGGHCVNSLGAGDEELLAALTGQWRTLSFATNLVEHRGRDEFLGAWAGLMPAGEWRVFASNSGAEANENLLKMALATTERPAVVCFEGAFHGRTAGAAAVSAGAGGFPRGPFDVRRLAWGEVAGIDGDVAAVILEPIQSLAGVVDPPPGFLENLRAACDEAGAWLLFDEVQTGCGRLGPPWASQHFGVQPDAFSAAKGIAGGLALGLSFVRAGLAGEVPAGLCGSTFGGSPMSLAASTVVARRIAAPGFSAHVHAVARELASLAGIGPVRRVRGAGLLVGLELDRAWSAARARDALFDQGYLTGTCVDPGVLRLSPSLEVSLAEVAGLRAALAELEVPA